MYGKGAGLGIARAVVSPNTEHPASWVTVGGQVGQANAESSVLGLSMAHICPRVSGTRGISKGARACPR